MDKKTLILMLSVVAAVFLGVQACGLTTGIAIDCETEGGIVCSDEKAYQCQLSTSDFGGFASGFYVTRASAYDADCALEVEGVDTDGDGLTDDEEALEGTDETSSDTDGDGLSDGYEVNTAGTDPLDKDTDGDTLNDYKELFVIDTDPLDTDSDGDGYLDNIEVKLGYDPTDAADHPSLLDTDGDGLSDEEEAALGTDPAVTDSDGDTLSDYDEVYTYGTDPLDEDSDDDGYKDWFEVETLGTDPLNADTDGDGLTDMEEYGKYTTDPLNTDTDGGGVSDGDEVAAGTDPLDATDDAATTTTTTECKEATEATDCGGYGCKITGTCYTSCTMINEASACATGYDCTVFGKCKEVTTSTTTTATAYEVTDITDASIDSSAGYPFYFTAKEGTIAMMGYLDASGIFNDLNTNNPISASPLIIYAQSASALSSEHIVIVTTDNADTELNIYLPMAGSLTGKYFGFYVADDGSTYWADSGNDGIESDKSDMLSAEDALTSDHLARAAEANADEDTDGDGLSNGIETEVGLDPSTDELTSYTIFDFDSPTISGTVIKADGYEGTLAGTIVNTNADPSPYGGYYLDMTSATTEDLLFFPGGTTYDWSFADWFVIKAMVMPGSSTSVNQPLVIHATSTCGKSQYALDLYNGEYRFSANIAGTMASIKGGTATSGTWQEVVAVYKDDVLSLFVDGELVDTTATSGALASSTQRLYLGHNDIIVCTTPNDYEGYLDTVTLWGE